MRKVLLLSCCLGLSLATWAQKQMQLTSPDGRIQATVEIGEKLTYQVSLDGKEVLAPSPLSMTLSNGEVWGDNAKLAKSSRESSNTTIPSPFYKRSEVVDNYNQLTLSFKKQWKVQWN